MRIFKSRLSMCKAEENWNYFVIGRFEQRFNEIFVEERIKEGGINGLRVWWRTSENTVKFLFSLRNDQNLRKHFEQKVRLPKFERPSSQISVYSQVFLVKTSAKTRNLRKKPLYTISKPL